MDEYLSKPLQQNHLIQTILKCATLGGQLLEKNRERELARAADAATGGRRDNPSLSAAYQSATAQATAAAEAAAATSAAASAGARPSLATRAITAAEGLTAGLESPSIVTADQEDPMGRARTSSLSAPNIHAA
jgi:osomolarity two-component system sensor histidine kinase NIK1